MHLPLVVALAWYREDSLDERAVGRLLELQEPRAGREVPIGVAHAGVTEVVESTGSCCSTSVPSRYQPSRVRMANRCQKSCPRGPVRSPGRRRPISRDKRQKTRWTY